MNRIVEDVGVKTGTVDQNHPFLYIQKTITYPPVTEIGVEPNRPDRNLKTIKAGQFGAKHVPNMNAVNAA